jgi:Zn-dependent protease
MSAMILAGVEVAVSPRAVAETAVTAGLSAVLAVRHGAGWPTAGAVAGTVIAVAVLSTLAHELGHLVVARRLGLPVFALRMTGLLSGALERGTTGCPRAELRICLAGPAVTAALATAGALLARWGGPLSPVGLCLGVANGLALLACALPPSRSDLGRAVGAARRLRASVPARLPLRGQGAGEQGDGAELRALQVERAAAHALGQVVHGRDVHGED